MTDSIRMLIVTGDSPVYLPRFFSVFLNRARLNPAPLVVMVPMVKNLSFAMKRLLSMPTYFFPLLAYGAFKRIVPSSDNIDNVCRRYNSVLKKIRTVSGSDFSAILKQYDPDLIVSVGCPQIFPEKIVNSENRVCINFHGGQIPVYRGCMTPFWALINRDPIVLTWHMIEKRIDSGPILLQKPLSFDPSDSFHSISIKIMEQGAILLAENLEKIKSEQAKPVDLTNQRYYSWPEWKEWVRFRKYGNRLW